MNEPAVIDARLDELAGEEDIDLREYWRTILKHAWGILGLTLVVVLLAALVVYSIEPVYRSTATLLIEAETAKVVSIEEVYGIPGANREYYQTQFEILKSRELAERVIERLSLAEHPEFDPDQHQSAFRLDWRAWLPEGWLPDPAPPTAEELRNALATDFSSRLEVEPVRNSQLVHITFEANDRELAARMANVLADAYIESGLEARLQMTQKASVWLTERLGDLRKKLEDSEKALQAYRERERLVDVAGVKSIAATELDQLASKLVEARRQRAEAEALYRQVQAVRGNPADHLESIPAVLDHRLVQELKTAEAEAERKVSELAKRYGPQHPKMIAARSELSSARSSTYRQVAKVVRGIAKEYEVARANEADLSRSMSASKVEVQEINRKEYQLGVLEREVESNRQLYDLFLNRFKETTTAGDVQSANARIVDAAVPATEPAKPRKKLVLIIAALLGGVLGMALAFLLEYLDNTLKGVEDVERRLGLPALGLLPKLKTRGRADRSPLRHFLEQEKSSFSEAVRTVRTGILLSGLDKPHKVVLVTSSVPGEGKTTLAVNLAVAFGRNNAKVLLVEGDLRRPTIGKAVGLPEAAQGLSQFTAGSAKLSDCVHEIERGGSIFVMPSGLIPPNPLELLSSKRFAQALTKLRESFDQIVIDCAPALAVSDAQVLSARADTVLYLVKSDSTAYQAAQEGLKRLRQVGAPVVGVVLNQMPTRKSGYGRYGHYRGDYYAHYGYAQKA